MSCLGVATAKNIEEGFEDHGQLLEWGNEAIDAFVFNENGKLYITWKAYGLTKGKTIQILGAELSPDGLSVKGEAFEMLTAEKGLMGEWRDGRTVYRSQGWVPVYVVFRQFLLRRSMQLPGWRCTREVDKRFLGKV